MLVTSHALFTDGRLTVKVNIEFTCARSYIFVAFLVEMASGLAVRFTHQIVFDLASIAKGFGCAGIIPIPGLSGATTRSERPSITDASHTFEETYS